MAQDIVGSKMKDFPVIQPANRDNTKTGYGENGYSGASSDTDLKNPTRSRLAVALDPNPKVVFVDQTRKLPPGNVPTAFGMKGAAKGPTIGAPVRPAEAKL
jgi:hypothetical protein